MQMRFYEQLLVSGWEDGRGTGIYLPVFCNLKCKEIYDDNYTY